MKREATSVETVRRYFEAIDTHDVDGIEALVADSLAFVTPVEPLHKPTFLAFMRGLFEGFPDLRFEHGALEARGDVVSTRLRIHGTHTGTLALPMPGLRPVGPTGRRVVLPEQRFDYTVAGGRIVRIQGEPLPHAGVIGMLEQLGVKLPPVWVMKTVARVLRLFRRER
jgi:predicted ester cyclase